jgi:TIR domain
VEPGRGEGRNGRETGAATAVGRDPQATEEVPATAGTSDTGPLVFISHRHVDKKIADTIREFLVSRSGGLVDVFQSSSAAAKGPLIGGILSQELAESLWRSHMVILLYTGEDQDWAWCMWECGVATQPETPYTRIIVFQVGTTVPAMFENTVRVDLHAAMDVDRFTQEFLTSASFFPRYGKPITRFQPNDPNVKQAAQAFYEDLQRVAPPINGDSSCDWPTYPYLRLGLTADQIGAINENATVDATRDALTGAEVADADREALRIFGFREMPPERTLGRLLERWNGEFRDDAPNWLDGLASQVLDAVRNRFPTLRWELMRGVDRNDGTLYAPVVNRVRKTSAQSMQFDIYFNKFELDEERGCVRVGIQSSLSPRAEAG